MQLSVAAHVGARARIASGTIPASARPAAPVASQRGVTRLSSQRVACPRSETKRHGPLVGGEPPRSDRDPESVRDQVEQRRASFRSNAIRRGTPAAVKARSAAIRTPSGRELDERLVPQFAQRACGVPPGGGRRGQARTIDSSASIAASTPVEVAPRRADEGESSSPVRTASTSASAAPWSRTSTPGAACRSAPAGPGGALGRTRSNSPPASCGARSSGLARWGSPSSEL